MNHWTLLGIEPTPDARAVKRAYAKQLKQTHPEDNPQGFQALRAAYEAALEHARYLDASAYAQEADADLEVPGPGEAPALVVTHQAIEIMETAAIAEPLEIAARDAQDSHAIWEQAGVLLQRLIDLSRRTDEALLLSTLKQWLHDDTLLNMDLRLAFEERLLHWLARLEELPPLFVEGVAEIFDWRHSVWHLSAEAANAWQYLWQRMLLLRGRRDLERMAESGVGYGFQPESHHAVWQRCARLLRMPYARWRFQWAALSNQTQDAMGALLTYLAQQTPGTLETLDAQTVAWWQRAVLWPRIRLAQVLIALFPAFFLSMLLNEGFKWGWCNTLGKANLVCGDGLGWVGFYLGSLVVMYALSLAGVLAIQHKTQRSLLPWMRRRLTDPVRSWIYGLETWQKIAYWLLLVALSMVGAEWLPEAWRWLAYVIYGASILWLLNLYAQFFILLFALSIAAGLEEQGLGLERSTWVMISHFLLLLAVSTVWKKFGSKQA